MKRFPILVILVFLSMGACLVFTIKENAKYQRELKALQNKETERLRTYQRKKIKEYKDSINEKERLEAFNCWE